MNRKRDIEDLLMKCRIEPGARVKRAVLARYADRYGRARGAEGTMTALKRPVPLYIAAAFVLLAAGLSFIGGQRIPRSERARADSSIATQDSLIREALKQSLQFAPRDVF